MNSINNSQNSPRQLDQLRTVIRYKHYSYATEKAYVYWARFYIRFNNLQHPAKMGATLHGKGDKDRVVMLPTL